MDFSFTDEQIAIRDTIDHLMLKEGLGWIKDAETTGAFPRPFMEKMTELGILGMNVDPKYGGEGADYSLMLTAIETLAYHSMAFALNVIVQATLGQSPIERLGTEEQKQKYLPRMIKDGLYGCFANTTCDAGSDAKNIENMALKDGNEFILKGAKQFITNASEAEVFIISARTAKRSAGKPGITLFVMDRVPEIEVIQEKKNCQYGATLCQIVLHDVKVKKGNILGKINEGWRGIEDTFNHSRPAIAMQGAGGARRVRDEILKYTSRRTAFSKPLLKQDVIRTWLADLHTQIETTRLLAYRAADEEIKNVPTAGITASMAKLMAGATGRKAADLCFQCFGGQSALAGSMADKHGDELRIVGVYEGPDPIQRKIIADYLEKSLLPHLLLLEIQK